MIFGNRDNIPQNAYLSEGFRKAFDYLTACDPALLPEGKIELDGDKVFLRVQGYDTTPDSRYETHRAYYDIQMIVAGEERIAVLPREELTEDGGYLPDKDMQYYHWKDGGTVYTLKAGDFLIFAPEDGHAPHLMTGDAPSTVKKILVKVKI